MTPSHLHGTVTDTRELLSIRSSCTLSPTCLEQIWRQLAALCWSRLQSKGSFKLHSTDFAPFRLCAIQAELLYFRFPIWNLPINIWVHGERTDHFRDPTDKAADENDAVIHTKDAFTDHAGAWGITDTGWCFDGDWGAANTLKGIQLYKLISLPLSICLYQAVTAGPQLEGWWGMVVVVTLSLISPIPWFAQTFA